MTKLPLEEINGAMYQPVEGNGTPDDCFDCVLDFGKRVCMDSCCCSATNPDGLDIYYVNPEVQP